MPLKKRVAKLLPPRLKARLSNWNHSVEDRVVTPAQWRFNNHIWLLIALVFAVDVAWAWALGWHVDWEAMQGRAASLTGLAALCFFFSRVRKRPEFALIMHITLQLIILLFVCAIFSYVSATIGRPLYDETFIAIDRMLGFDWYAYVYWVRSHPTLAWLSTFGYTSTVWQAVLMFVLLMISGNLDQLQRFLHALLVSVLITCIIAAFFPAVAGYLHYNIDPASLPGNHAIAAARLHEEHFNALRNGTYNTISSNFQGIITFPSFHVTYGLLLLYGFWPLKWFRLPALIINVLLILSIPVDGGHYLIDGIVGALIAGFVVLLANRLLPPQKHTS